MDVSHNSKYQSKQNIFSMNLFFRHVFQMGMGGDHRTSDPGAHVRQPDHWRVRLGPTRRRQHVSTDFILLGTTQGILKSSPIKADLCSHEQVELY